MAISMTVIMYFLKRVCPLSRTSDGTEMFASHVWLPLRSLTLNNFSNVFSLSDEFSIEAFKCCLHPSVTENMDFAFHRHRDFTLDRSSPFAFVEKKAFESC
jgi:hypothetical protein